MVSKNSVSELTKKLEEFKDKFKDPKQFDDDYFLFVNWVMDCVNSNDNILIFKAVEKIAEIRNDILISNKFCAEDSVMIVRNLNTLDQYCAIASGKFCI